MQIVPVMAEHWWIAIPATIWFGPTDRWRGVGALP
jgi:hypothetical protein